MPEEINFYSRGTEYGWLSNFDRTPVRFGEHRDVLKKEIIVNLNAQCEEK